MFVHKDAVDSQGLLSLMKTSSMLTLAGLGSSVYATTLRVGAGIVERLVGDRGFEAILKLFVLTLAVCAIIVVGMFLVYKYVEA